MPKIRVGREDAQAFVKSLKNFSDTLLPEQRAMLGTILDAAQQDETSGYGRRQPRRGEEDETAGYGKRSPRNTSDETAEEDETAGYGRRLQSQQSDGEAEQDDTAGYAIRRPRSETPSEDDEERWETLAEWLSKDDETSGYQAKYKF